MVSSHLGGKLLLFQSSVPSLGVGRVKARDNPQLYGTEREPGLRNPDDPFFKRYAAECSRVQLTVDVFAMSMQYADLASLAAIPRYTCGEVGGTGRTARGGVRCTGGKGAAAGRNRNGVGGDVRRAVPAVVSPGGGVLVQLGSCEGRGAGPG